MSRRVVWLQLLIGWLPVWGLFTALVVTAHQTSWHLAALLAIRTIVAAALLGLAVQRLTERFPWPHPVRPHFVAAHCVFAAVYAIALLVLNSIIESVWRGRMVISVGPSLTAFLILGVWLYVMIAGVSYTALATGRAARAEANAARAQLAALRSQLNPHFLFNALHTVVQLIPREPKRAAQAAEQLAGLLRGTIEEDRDLVSVSEEWAFVERYLAIERIRFGDRLRVHVKMTEESRRALIPVFAVQTLIENAVRHGAAPRVEPTDITITGSMEKGALTFVVHDTGGGASVDQLEGRGGTGIKRLRDRLAVLYGSEARLEFASGATGGFSASLVIPFVLGDA
jgi:hypothetical protein